MTISDEDFVTAIAKLNDLTRSGQIRWQRVEDIRLANSVGVAYTAKHEGRNIRIVEYSPPRARGFFTDALSREQLAGVVPAKEIILEITDDQGHTLFEFPKVQGIADLFDTVRFQLTDVEGFIRSLAR